MGGYQVIATMGREKRVLDLVQSKKSLAKR